MSYEIDRRKVAGVVTEAARAIDNKDFNHGEVIVGLSELIGRVIVDVAPSHIQMKQMVDIVNDHMNRTIVAGNDAKGKSLIERV
jgi:hypothetical protein